MNHVNILIGEHGTMPRESAWNVEPVSCLFHSARKVAESDHLHPESSQGFNMNRADEAGANDSRSEIIKRGFAVHRVVVSRRQRARRRPEPSIFGCENRLDDLSD
jgi:hypothetical protein